MIHLLQVHISDLSCSPGSSWISQLQHLGATLARLQRLTDTLQAPPATAAGQQQQQQAASSQQIALAVAAGVLQPVVLALQKAISDAAAAAVAAASDPQFRKVGWDHLCMTGRTRHLHSSVASLSITTTQPQVSLRTTPFQLHEVVHNTDVCIMCCRSAL